MTIRQPTTTPLRRVAIAVLRAAGSTQIGCAGQGCRGGRRPERCTCGLLRSTPAGDAARTSASAWLQIEHSEQPSQPPAEIHAPCTLASPLRRHHQPNNLPLPWTARHLAIATASVAALAALLWLAELINQTQPGA